jgi:hypothetical protein
VFDLDNTLIDTKNMEMMKRDDQLIRDALNKNIINLVLDQAEIVRSEYPGSIDAILLLTNNNDSEYVSRVCKVIAEMLQSKRGNFRRIRNAENNSISNTYPLFFDYIMMRENKHRNNKPLEKNISLVETMLNALNIKTSNLKKRTFFFDDQEHPVMRSDLADGHYIKIIGPVPDAGFLKDSPDLTNYEPILQVLRSIVSNGGPNNTPANGGPGAYHPGGAPYESNNEFNRRGPGAYHPGGAPYESNNENAARGGRKRRYRTLKGKSKKRKTIRRRK